MVLLGAVINAQVEGQTRKDSTEGGRGAMEQRDAHAADTLGESTAEGIDWLKSRLQRDCGGPLVHLASEATDALAARAQALAGWVRDHAEELPRVSVALRFPAGLRRR